MQVQTTTIPGLLVIQPQVFGDPRGFFLETFQQQRYREAGITADFVQDNYSRSSQGILRGLHYQIQHPQGKLVQVLHGKVFDVVVDLRKPSPAFGRWFSIELSEETCRQVFVPPGCAHGFCVLSDEADYMYQVTEYWDGSDATGVAWNDPDLAVPWPISDPIVSERDQHNPTMRELFPGRYS